MSKPLDNECVAMVKCKVLKHQCKLLKQQLRTIVMSFRGLVRISAFRCDLKKILDKYHHLTGLAEINYSKGVGEVQLKKMVMTLQ